MYEKSATDLELEKSVKEYEVSLRETFAQNYYTQQQTLELFKKTIEHCNLNNFKENKLIWNFASYINIVSFDLKIIGENLFLSTNDWGKRYFARQSALIIYESLNDIFELSGKEFRNILSRFSADEELKTEIKQLTTELNEYKHKYFNKLKTIRNNCVAHRDKDCIEQLKIITSLNWFESVETLTGFDKILMKYGVFMQKVIDISLEESKELIK